MDENTFLTTVYCIVDDCYHAHLAAHKPRRRGVKPTVSDSEVLTLALLAQWHPSRHETALLRYARQHWRAYFPHLLSQSAFNRRARDLWGALVLLGQHLAAQFTTDAHTPSPYAVLDGVPVPLMRRCRGDHHRLFADQAGIGKGGSDKAWYYGVQLLTAVTDRGAITGWTFAPASTDIRWSTEALLRGRADATAPAPTAAEFAARFGPSHAKGGMRRGPTGPFAPPQTVGTMHAAVLIADGGFRGPQWQEHWRRAYQVTVQTRADYAHGARQERVRGGQWLSGLRQVTERVNAALSTVLGLAYPQARSWWGVLTRVSAKVAAHNLSLLLNVRHGFPPFRALHPFG